MEKKTGLFSSSKNELFNKTALDNLSAQEDLEELFKLARISPIYYISAVLLFLVALIITIVY